MKILELRSENVKRLKAATIKPDGALVVIGGDNDQGKSSVLDSIVYALGGKSTIPPKPLRSGAKNGKVVVKLDGDDGLHLSPLTVERTFSDSGKTQLRITTDDGYEAPSPQSILDGLCARGLAFDPLAFTRKSPKEQAEMLRKIVGLDFSELDQKRKQLYDQRTEVNRDGKALRARFDAMPFHDDAPKEEVSVAELIEERKRREAVNRQNQQQRSAVATAERKCEQLQREAFELEEQIRQLQLKLEAKQADRKSAESQLETLKAAVSELKDEDTSDIDERVASAVSLNSKLASNLQRATVEKELEALREESARLSEDIDDIDAEKLKQTSEAQWPVEGLGFDENGVTFKGLPFEQSSSSDQLCVAASIGLAMNPALRVLLIHDGSLIGDKRLERLAKLAADKDAQIWIERVSTGEECSVIIEDGAVKEVREAVAAGV